MKKHLLRGLLLLSSTTVLCGCGGHWEDFEKTIGYRGKARVNPFLAAERLLNELGHDARGVKVLAKMPAHDAVILVSGDEGLPAGRARQLLRWTYSGGHLIYCLGGTRPYNDFDTQFGSFIASLLLEKEKDPVLEQLGVNAKKRVALEEMEALLKQSKDKAGPAGKEDAKKGTKKKKKDEDDESHLESVLKLRWQGKSYEVSLGGHQHLVLNRGLRAGEFSAGPKNEALALHLHHGMGRVTLLAHARPFRNRWIAERDHARWLSALVGEHGAREVLFVASTHGSFLGLLWRHGWMALTTLAVCLLFWLWQQMPRFGPLTEPEIDPTRHFASHIGALGEFFWRMKRGALLVQAAREAVWERVRERHRPLDDGSHQISDRLAEEIARRTGIPVKRVTAAFEAPPPESAHNFVALMRDLQAIRRAL